MNARLLIIAPIAFATIVSYVQGDAPGIDAVARQFRIRTYERLRTDRAEYDRQIQLADDVLRKIKIGDLTESEGRTWFESQYRNASADPLPFSSPTMQPQFTHPIPIETRLSPLPTTSPITNLPIKVEPQSSSTPIQTHTISSPQVKINVDVLRARIESTNLLLESLEGQLHPDARRLFPDELAQIVEQLDTAFDRYALSQTYVKLLSTDELKTVPLQTEIEPIVKSLSRRLFNAQIRAHERLANDGSSQDQKDVQLLQELSRRVRSWQNL